ncbi:hypothetical protein ACIQUQ_20715 [Streptomyces sp. NPDC101118]|uniref:hypothetical protein n=1 Tax=Streptomyces sp. NPDC101118 TaxID=3366109 RepID=UPI00381DD616
MRDKVADESAQAGRNDGGDGTGPGGPTREPSLSGNTWPVLFLAPALALLRFFGEQAWAYWSAAVLAAVGVPAAAVGVAVTVRALSRGRQPLVALWVIGLLAGGSWVLLHRLVSV